MGHTDKGPVRRQKKTKGLQEGKETESQVPRTRIVSKLLVKDRGKMPKFDEQHHSEVNLFRSPSLEWNLTCFEKTIQINGRKWIVKIDKMIVELAWFALCSLGNNLLFYISLLPLAPLISIHFEHMQIDRHIKLDKDRVYKVRFQWKSRAEREYPF